MSSDVLAIRAKAHQLRPLLMGQLQSKAQQRLQRQIERLQRKRPQKLSGRHIFLQELFQQLQSSHESISSSLKQAVFKQHGEQWHRMPEARRQEYSQLALQLSEQKRQTVLADLAFLRTAQSLQTSRADAEKSEDAGKFLVLLVSLILPFFVTWVHLARLPQHARSKQTKSCVYFLTFLTSYIRRARESTSEPS